MSPHRRSDAQPLKAAIEQFLEKYRLKDKVNEARLIAAWDKVVGEMVAKRTSGLNIRDKVLYVRVESAPLKSELMFARSKLIIALNREVGGNVINEIVLT